MRTIAEKEAIITNRGESNNLGSLTKLYSVEFNDGKTCSMVCMNGESLQDAKSSCIDRFRDNFKNIKAT